MAARIVTEPAKRSTKVKQVSRRAFDKGMHGALDTILKYQDRRKDAKPVSVNDKLAGVIFANTVTYLHVWSDWIREESRERRKIARKGGRR